MTPVTVHSVQFGRTRPGDYPVTWAQRGLLRYCESLGPAGALLNVHDDTPLVGRPRLADALRGIRAVMRRYEALRTTFTPEATGGWRQQVAAEGQVEVPEFAADPATVAATAAEVTRRLTAPAFGDGWPVRFALITVDGGPVRLVVARFHPCVDGIGASIACAEVARLARPAVADPAEGGDTLAAWQPRDIAAYEQSTPGQRQAERADRYLREQLCRAPVRPRGERPARRRDLGVVPTFVWVQLESSAIAGAAEAVACRIRRNESTPGAR